LPVIERYRDRDIPKYFRGESAFALPRLLRLLERKGFHYAIRLKANPVLERKITHLLKRPVGRPSHKPKKFYASFRYRARSWECARRVVAKVEWHEGVISARCPWVLAESGQGLIRVVKSLHLPLRGCTVGLRLQIVAQEGVYLGKTGRGRLPMRDRLPAGPYDVLCLPDGTEVPWYIVPFDEQGLCTAPSTRAECLRRATGEGLTDVFVFSHGWNNTWKWATKSYASFIEGFGALCADHHLPRPAGYRPMLIGLFWPSIRYLLPWERAPQMAGDDAPLDEDAVAAERQELAELARDVPPEKRGRFYELAQADGLRDEAAARELAALLLASLRGEDEIPGRPGAPTVDGLLNAWRALGQDLSPDPGPGIAGTVDDGPAPAPQPALFGLPGPRDLLRGPTVWKMKDRAKVVGREGAGRLLRDLLEGRAARVHLIGHSYGCQVLLAGLCSEHFPAGKRVESALLLQPAVSAHCFAVQVHQTGQPGFYRPALERVRQPVTVTYSQRDKELYRYYHNFVDRYQEAGERHPAAGIVPYYAALGGYGPQGCRADELRLETLLAPTQAYSSIPGSVRVLGLESTAHIDGHSEIAKPAVYWRLYTQVTAGRA
jgi:hypothetical protein